MYVIHQTTAYVLARSGFVIASNKTYTMPTHMFPTYLDDERAANKEWWCP